MRYLALSFAILAGCGPLAGENPLAGLVTVPGGEDAPVADAAPADPRQVLTRDIIEGLPNDLLLVEVPTRGAVATLLPVGQNGPRQTWVSPDGISVTVESGLIVATRGFGHDLMAADVSGLRAVLSGAASGQYVLETLDGRDQVVRQVFDCAIEDRTPDPVTIFERTYSTTKLFVVCGNSDIRFGNFYWVDRSGKIWKSQQFTTPELGHMGTEVL